MTRHLREEEVCAWIAGESSPETEQHLGECGACRSQVALMSEALGAFRDSVRERGEERLAERGAFPRRISGTMGRPAHVWHGLGWATLPVAATVTLFIAIAAWLPWHAFRSARPLEDAVAHMSGRTAHVPAADDVALLRRVDTEVSRTVPGPMEPLTALVEWRQESQRGTQSQPEHGSAGTQER